MPGYETMSAPSVGPPENGTHESRESLLQTGVKHMYDNGIERVPVNYVLPVADRPNVMIADEEADCPGRILELPVIDFAELLGPNRGNVLESLSHACENYGFFQLVNHSIPEKIITDMVDASRRFFETPLSEREKHMSADTSSPVRYGTSFNQMNDVVLSWRDFLKVVCDPSPEVLPPWPSSPSDFKYLAICYAKETKSLFLMLVKAILQTLGLNEPHKNTKTSHSDYENEGDDGDNEMVRELMENASQVMVVNCYPPCPQPDLTLGMPPHSDYGFLTLLLQDRVKGLQIQHQNDWVTVQPIPGSFVVNVGDHLEIFSNGRYKSVLHRVLVNPTDYRISVASLHSFPFATTVRPADNLITHTNPKRYQDTDFATFLNHLKSCNSTNKNFLESRKLTTTTTIV